MYLIIGLGNPGKEYSSTRHNVGYEAVEALAKRHRAKLSRSPVFMSKTAKVIIADKEAVLAFPLLYMNRSGEAVQKLKKAFDIETENIIVIHDELDLEPGVMRIKKGGGSAGHNGLKSVIDSIKGKDFIRIRIGIGKPRSREHGAEHVLSKPGKHAAAILKAVIAEAASATEDVVGKGLQYAMNRYNASAVQAK